MSNRKHSPLAVQESDCMFFGIFRVPLVGVFKKTVGTVRVSYFKATLKETKLIIRPVLRLVAIDDRESDQPKILIAAFIFAGAAYDVYGKPRIRILYRN